MYILSERNLFLFTVGHDLSIKNFTVPDLLTSGETVNFDLILEGIVIGAHNLSAPTADNFTLKLIKYEGDKGTGKNVFYIYLMATGKIEGDRSTGRQRI